MPGGSSAGRSVCPQRRGKPTRLPSLTEAMGASGSPLIPRDGPGPTGHRAPACSRLPPPRPRMWRRGRSGPLSPTLRGRRGCERRAAGGPRPGKWPAGRGCPSPPLPVRDGVRGDPPPSFLRPLPLLRGAAGRCAVPRLPRWAPAPLRPPRRSGAARRGSRLSGGEDSVPGEGEAFPQDGVPGKGVGFPQGRRTRCPVRGACGGGRAGKQAVAA